jgi:hypothetical protein
MKVANLIVGAVFAGLLVVAHAAADKRPKPPASVCIGSNCVTTPVGGKIKWNPGHYAASNGTLYGGTKASGWYPSMDGALANYPWIVGFRLWVTWGALETSKGVYDFTQVDAILNRLKTQYGTPRHLVLNLYHSGPSNQWKQGATSVVPAYIQQDSSYGPSPVGGSFGWWGLNTAGVSNGPYEPALWRPAVMARYIALVQAIGAHYDSDPNFEGMMFQEDVYSALTKGSDYTPAAMTTQAQNLLTAAVAAFPHTNVIFENTWGLGDGVTGAQNFEAWMMQNRVAAGTADTVGESVWALPMAAGRPASVNWGMSAYMGMADTGGKYTAGDLRAQGPAMLDIEADDIAGTYYRASGGPFSPADICAALNNRYRATHAFWTRFMGTEIIKKQPVPAVAKWPALAATLKTCPITNTAYPATYPND